MSLMRFVIWGHPRPQYGARRASQVAFGLFSLSLRGFVICPTQPFLNTPTPLLLRCRCSPLGVFPWCVFLFLFVLVRPFVAFLFPSVVWLVWRCLVVAAPGCCVLRPVPSLARWFGAVLLLVLALLLLPSWFRVWSVAWCGCVLVSVLSLARSGSSLFLCFASFLVGGSPPFLLGNWRSQYHTVKL